MVTVTFNELELNAVLAGLVQVIHQNSIAKANLKEQRDSPDNAFAIDCCNMAIRHALNAQLTIAASIPDPEYPGDMSSAQLDWRDSRPIPESEMRAVWGDR
jgi:hypothetical protein